MSDIHKGLEAAYVIGMRFEGDDSDVVKVIMTLDDGREVHQEVSRETAEKMFAIAKEAGGKFTVTSLPPS